MAESVFTYGAPSLKFGPGASDEVGYDLGELGVTRALLVTDPGVAATGHPARIAEQAVVRFRFSGFDHPEEPPAASAIEDFLDHPPALEAPLDRRAGLARLASLDQRRAEPEAIAEPDIVLRDAAHREVRPERARLVEQRVVAQFIAPPGVVVERVEM